MRVILPLVLVFGVILLFLASVTAKTRVTPPEVLATPQVQKQTVKVSRIVNGDTVVLETGEKVRYIGMDTPEKGECFFESAKDANSVLVLGKEVILEKDIQPIDKYGRTLAYVWVGDVMVNEEMVKQGFAHVATYPPDVKHQEKFRDAEREARETKRGLWAEGVCN